MHAFIQSVNNVYTTLIKIMYSYGEWAYHYSTAYTLHPHIAMISPCWHGPPLVYKKGKKKNAEENHA